MCVIEANISGLWLRDSASKLPKNTTENHHEIPYRSTGSTSTEKQISAVRMFRLPEGVVPGKQVGAMPWKTSWVAQKPETTHSVYSV